MGASVSAVIDSSPIGGKAISAAWPACFPTPQSRYYIVMYCIVARGHDGARATTSYALQLARNVEHGGLDNSTWMWHLN
jgi:hypothetical protein